MRLFALIVALLLVIQAASIGPVAAAEPFSDRALDAAAKAISADVNAAQIVFVGTVSAVDAAPPIWSGPAVVTQLVTYTVERSLVGSIAAGTLPVEHPIVAGSRLSGSTPGVNATLLPVGAKVIVCVRTLGEDELIEGAAGPVYRLTGESYAVVPWTAQNERAVLALVRFKAYLPAALNDAR